ncbi:MAG: glycoside hydrolase family 43 protein [Velocimicrobium sp.]
MSEALYRIICNDWFERIGGRMRTYHNPIAKKGDFADPFVLRYNGKYYLYCTNPDIRCWSSDDLLEWKLEGATIDEDEFKDLVPFAPEVIYADGKFYMYTSPSGFGHYVLASERPTGPFRKISPNVQHAIDGTVFIDDDGNWYFYWAGDEGIWGCEMKSPTEFGEPVLTGATMYGWTEGPLIYKRDGIYYMTYTGNHYLSKGYRINAASSSHPLEGYVDEVYNPVIIHTQDEVVGLGHSSTVIGPDLVSNYIVYHNMNEDAIRDLDIDRQLWYQNVTQIVGPTRNPQPAPNLPDYAFTTDKARTLDLSVVLGKWKQDDDIFFSTTNIFCVLSKKLFFRCFTAEFNVVLLPDSQLEKRGIVLTDGSNDYKLVFDEASRKVELWLDQGEGSNCIARNDLPKTYRFETLHCIRVEKKESKVLEIYIDNRLQFKNISSGLAATRIGYFSEGGSIGCGFTAITESVLENEMENVILPMECAFYPVFGTGTIQRNPDGSILVKEDESIEYSLITDTDTDYVICITCNQVEKIAKTEVLLDGRVVGNCLGNRGVENFSVKLSQGNHTLRLKGKTGTLAIKRMKLVQVKNTDEPVGNMGPVRIGPHGKYLAGESFWNDYTVTAEFSADMLNEDSKAGVLMRVTEPAEGGEGDDQVLGIHFFIGYSISVSRSELCVIRHSYDEKVLAVCPYEYTSGQTCDLDVELNGSEITVYVDHEAVPRITVNDSNPIVHGCAGIWAKGSVMNCKSIKINR